MNRQLFELLKETDGLSIPLLPDRGSVQNKRRANGSKPGDFPPEFITRPPEK